MLGDLPGIVPRRNYDIRTQCLKGTCSSSELPGRWHVSLFLDAACPCRGCSSMFFRKRPHGKDGCESHCRIRSIVLVFRIERMTGFEPAVSCLGSRRAAAAPHPHGPARGRAAGPAVSRAAGGRPLSAYPIAGARRLDVTSFLGMSALTRGGMPHVVEPAGFEPATFPLRTGRPATGRRPRSAPDPIRTGDTRIRNPVLCPLSYKGVHPPCDGMRPRTGLGGLGRDHGAGMVADGRIKEERTRLACHRSRTRGEKSPASRAGGVHAMNRFEPRAGHDPATFRLRGGRSTG